MTARYKVIRDLFPPNAEVPRIIQRIAEDGAVFIFGTDSTSEWSAYQDWLEAGNTPEDPSNPTNS